MLLASDLFTRDGLGQFLFRWLHVLAGITWIGLLYFFNVVQVPAYAQFEQSPNEAIGGKARLIAIDKVTRKALWWFRWAAVGTFLTGIIIVGLTKEYFSSSPGWANAAILTGMLLGTIMLLNVWGVIWRCQKVVLANAANVLAGGQPNPDAAVAGRRAVMASRQNTIFSVSMLWFMVLRGHGAVAYGLSNLGAGKGFAYWIIVLAIIAVLELNCLGLLPWKTAPNKGLNALYDGPGVRNPIIAAFGLWAVFLILGEIFFS
ncbi:MAG: hypothetical protein QM733_11045 [Ilumatobacteraceae bacterium]